MSKQSIRYILWILRYLSSSPLIPITYGIPIVISFFISPNRIGIEEIFVVTFLMFILLLLQFNARFVGIFERGEIFFYMNAPTKFNSILLYFMFCGLAITMPLSAIIFENSGIYISLTLFVLMVEYIYFYFVIDVLISITFRSSLISLLTIVFMFIAPLFAFQDLMVSNNLSEAYNVISLSPIDVSGNLSNARLHSIEWLLIIYSVIVTIILSIIVKLSYRRDLL